ncbi:MAG: hypothetical protein ACO3AF_06600 [Flavobacteriales bacterium]
MNHTALRIDAESPQPTGTSGRSEEATLGATATRHRLNLWGEDLEREPEQAPQSTKKPD